MTSYTDETVSNLIINKLTKAQYDAITTPSETELYIVTDEEVLPDQTGNSGKYLATNGTTASWETVTMPTIDQTYNASSSNAQSGVAINGAGFLKNTATGLNALTIEGVQASSGLALNIGKLSIANATGAVALGVSSSVNVLSDYGIAIGNSANSYAKYAIQLGHGDNSEANSFYVGTSNSNNWKMLGSDGKIPSGRLPIATSVSSSSTNDETVGAKLFYDTCGDIEAALHAINSGGVLTETINIKFKINMMEGGIASINLDSNSVTYNDDTTYTITKEEPHVITITGDMLSSSDNPLIEISNDSPNSSSGQEITNGDNIGQISWLNNASYPTDSNISFDTQTLKTTATFTINLLEDTTIYITQLR